MSTVYFIDLRAGFKENFLQKLNRLADTAGLSDVVKPRDLVAIKLHFGETGNTAFIRPIFIRRIVDALKAAGANPFLTDANTLYAGTRGNAPQHLSSAICNGFAFSVVGAPLVIADGLRGKSETPVVINQKRFKRVYIGSEIVRADALVSVAHFKCHELAGFGGTIKNVGMGCASRKGKMAQHSTLCPKVKKKKCIGCGDCAAHCAHRAILIRDSKANIRPDRCVGCGECILICPESAIDVRWNQSIPVFMENMVEYTLGVLKKKTGKALFLNFITNVTPACDCLPTSDAPIVPDVGVVASRDPVAIDQASADLVNQQRGLKGSRLKTGLKAGADKFKAVYPEVDWERQLDYAEQIGLGTRSYRLEKI